MLMIKRSITDIKRMQKQHQKTRKATMKIALEDGKDFIAAYERRRELGQCTLFVGDKTRVGRLLTAVSDGSKCKLEIRMEDKDYEYLIKK